MSKKIVIAMAILLAIGGGIILDNKLRNSSQGIGAFSPSISGLVEAKSTETVKLKNGDTYNLTASVVKKQIGDREIRMLGYNGMIPGPLFKVPQGAEVTINFKNELDIPTTIHSHGVRLDNAFDGVVGVTQKEVAPGGSFTYTIKFPDAGIYWYHPHLRDDYAQEMGLYGNYLVEPADPNYWSPVNEEIPIFLDDILLNNGTPVVFNKSSADYTLMGRFGNVMLVNGETNYTRSFQRGEVARFYITNAANTRVFNFSIPGVKMKRVGADAGKYERETFVDSVIISPSEREIVEVLFESAGTYKLTHMTPNRTYTLGTIYVTPNNAERSYSKEFKILRVNRDVSEELKSYRAYFDKTPDKRIALSVDLLRGMGGMMTDDGHTDHSHTASNETTSGQMSMNGMDHGSMVMDSGEDIEWEDDMPMMNTMSTSENVKWNVIDHDTGKQNMDIDWKFKTSDIIKISIFNDPKSAHPMQHPIHFHGQRFLVVSRDGAKNDNLVWKDTVLVKSGETVDILLDASNPGSWMAHCHILEHIEAGMMFKFEVQ